MSDGQFVMGLRARLGDERGLVVDVIENDRARRLVFGHHLERQEVVTRLRWLATTIKAERLPNLKAVSALLSALPTSEEDKRIVNSLVVKHMSNMMTHPLGGRTWFIQLE